MNEKVNHPKYYGGEENQFEPIKIIEYYDFNFSIGCVIKYLLRAGRKNKDTLIEDMEKAQWYLNREIQRLKKERTNNE